MLELSEVRRQEDGASAVEYGLLVAAIAAVIVVIVFILGGIVNNSFNHTCGKISAGSAGDETSTCK